MTDLRINCPFCGVSMIDDNDRNALEIEDLLGDWDCDNCLAAFEVRGLGKNG